MADRDNSDKLQVALAELRRHQVFAAKLTPATMDMYSNGYVYAIGHGIYPVFHEEVVHREDGSQQSSEDAFAETYRLNKAIVDEITDLLDQKFLAKEKFTFRQLEGPYDPGKKHWPGRNVRHDLAAICRYAYLSDLGNEQFWRDFMEYAPSEASDITRPLKSDEILRWVGR